LNGPEINLWINVFMTSSYARAHTNNAMRERLADL
jgi:hypothetical protein